MYNTHIANLIFTKLLQTALKKWQRSPDAVAEFALEASCLFGCRVCSGVLIAAAASSLDKSTAVADVAAGAGAFAGEACADGFETGSVVLELELQFSNPRSDVTRSAPDDIKVFPIFPHVHNNEQAE